MPSLSHPVRPPLYYRLVMQVLKPLYRLKVWWQRRQSPDYLSEVSQRFALTYPKRPDTEQVIWCHAVSLGETNTIAPMLDVLLEKGYGIWLTNTTHTGFTRAQQRFAEFIQTGQMTHSYVPVDTPQVVSRFLQHVSPCLALFVETELWATILYELTSREIRSVLVNARLSEKSFQSYQKFSSLSRCMMNNISLIIAQDVPSAKRFRQLGAPSKKIRMASSLKWSVTLPELPIIENHLLAVEVEQRPIWVAASTHAGEEEAVIQAHQKLIRQVGLENALLIIVPRHPERFDEVAKLIDASGLQSVRRSQQQPIQPETQVYLADTMGELMCWYQIADVAFVGGSCVNVGGHNPIEPASVGTPIIMGRYTQSCEQLVTELQQAGALCQVGDSTDVVALVEAVKKWLSSDKEAQQAGKKGRELVEKHHGAVQKQLSMILGE
ncbi:3-deoxy-D-manno-octulosonic acid transferase [Psychrobacter sp. I-STPA6b]|uniref:3-deoxy-D-manno-octulosonic acid transferase n=1 Tax=Psychrobacter sp. I-STPA6b TaxID=2585718 RepID=UPI001D0C119E|nr:3-deoxy-D-manno-octulosonic acid transferase [Psychrobacter sp. I-STPA6b]